MPTTKEDIEKARLETRKRWISEKVTEMIGFVNKYAKWNTDDKDYVSVWQTWKVPKKYANARDEIYGEMKQHFPDSTVIVTIETKQYLLWCWPYYELMIKVSWA